MSQFLWRIVASARARLVYYIPESKLIFCCDAAKLAYFGLIQLLGGVPNNEKRPAIGRAFS
ncbi:hypothetical protein ACVINW_007297 [Bradyrhizobium sp. USDA 4461]